MEVYAAFDDPRLPLRDVAALAQRAERIGFHGLLVPEAVHDAFLLAALALEHTTRLRIATSVALAFPRSPTTVAYAAWDLAAFSGGRFSLGLGSQVRANITGRFGVEWQPPVARMRDYVTALRAVWSCWQNGTRLEVETEHYRLSRMQPFFNPGPIESPEIPIHLGAVNPAMVRLAGEVADGLMTHPTNTSPRVLAERIAPQLRAGAEAAGRGQPPPVIASTFVATGADTRAVAEERDRLREHFGFLYSTPQYRATLDLYGWGDLADRLHELSREGRWGELKSEIPDTVFDTLVPSATYEEIPDVLARWYGGLADAIALRMPEDPRHDGRLGHAIETLAGRA